MNFRSPTIPYYIALGLSLALLLSSCGDSSESAAQGIEKPPVAVTVEQAKSQEVRSELFSVGRIVSRNTPTLAAEINARVVEVQVDEGRQVAQGQLLILLDTTAFELARQEAEADIQRLSASIANEERRVERYRDLKTRDMMPEERLDDAEAKLAVDRASLVAAQARLAISRDRLAKTRVSSPVNGVVETRHVSVGDYAQVGGALITLTDTVELRIELPFPETVGHMITEGQDLYLESPILPGLVVQSKVGHIRPQLGSMNRSLVVITELVNPGNWRPQATVEATLVVDVRPDAVVVPAAAVVKRPAGNVVYVVDSANGGVARQIRVEPGVNTGGMIEIRAGLAVGSRVVVEGAHYLSEGARIAVKESTE
jgi:membrane fusion protein (multidrug efflux system)